MRGLSPRQVSLASPSPSQVAAREGELGCSGLQVQLLLPWATEATATGHRAGGHPGWGHTLGPAPSLWLSCCAPHLTFTHFIQHLLHVALPGLPAEREQTSQSSGQGHKSPRLAEAPCAWLISGGSGRAPPGSLRHFLERAGLRCMLYIPQSEENRACLHGAHHSEPQ